MTYNIIIREQAKMDLINIIEYISILIQNPHNANKISSLIIMMFLIKNVQIKSEFWTPIF